MGAFLVGTAVGKNVRILDSLFKPCVCDRYTVYPSVTNNGQHFSEQLQYNQFHTSHSALIYSGSKVDFKVTPQMRAG